MQSTIHLRARAAWRKPGRLSLVRKAARAALSQAVLLEPDGQLEWTIRLSDDADLRQLNRQFRGMDKPTDVLSFGGERYQDGKRISPAGGAASDVADGEYLGDIVISMERCAAQAAAAGHDSDHELALLVVHGTLHLLGYDHDTRARKSRMWSAQTRALNSIGLTLDVP